MKKALSILALALILLVASCRKDKPFYTGSDATLEFLFDVNMPADTVYFDTVFTRLGGTSYPRSVNKQFFIVNRLNNPVKTDIILAGGTNSSFRINVDGVSSTNFKDVEIPAKDSLIAFVEVTLEANNQINPAIVTDSILFNTNGNRQKMILAAYGWDAIYYRDSVISQNLTWDKTDVPYVIVNSILVAENYTLSIKSGVNVYSSPGSSLYVMGTLDVEGTESSPAVFQGDRLQPGYGNVAGQWQGIHFLKTSINNKIKNAVITSATIGIRVDSLTNNSNPKLDIRQTMVRDCSYYGIIGITADLYAENVATARCGSGFIGYFGGNYNLRHCTFASGYAGGRSQPAFIFNNIERDENDKFVRSFPISYEVHNSIIYGPLDDEVILDIDKNNPPSSGVFNHCIIKTDEYIDLLKVNDNILNEDPKFIEPREVNFGLRNNSPAIGTADILSPAINIDLTGKGRKSPADIGAYESE